MPDNAEPINGKVCLETYENNLKIQDVVDRLVVIYKTSDDVDKIAEAKESIASLNRVFSLNMDATPFRRMEDLKNWLVENGMIKQ